MNYAYGRSHMQMKGDSGTSILHKKYFLQNGQHIWIFSTLILACVAYFLFHFKNCRLKPQMYLFLSAFIVSTGLTSVRPNNEESMDSSAIQANFHNFFDSVRKNDAWKTETYRNFLKHEARSEQDAFDRMKKELRLTQQRKTHKQRNLHHMSGDVDEKARAFKREANVTDDEPRLTCTADQDAQNVSSSDLKEIFEAAEKNDVEKVKSMVEKDNVPIWIIDDSRRTLAHAAAKNGSLDVVEYVAKKYPPLLMKTDKDDFSVLRTAIRAGALQVVEYLVETHETDLTKRSERDFKSTSIHTAIKYGRLDILKYLIEGKHFAMDTPGEFMDQPPIFSAVKYGQEDIINYLIGELGVNMEQLDGRRENILFLAVRMDSLPYMKYFLEEKLVRFDLNATNEYGETLAFRAASLNRTSILEYLVEEWHVDLNIADKYNDLTPLHCAAILNNYKICKYLIDHGAKPDLKDNAGQIPAEKTSDKELKLYLRSASILKKKRNRRSASFQSQFCGTPEV